MINQLFGERKQEFQPIYVLFITDDFIEILAEHQCLL